ncbi:Copper resistance protein B [hydrothermal vent metagenome]|uniref:Copper resistance protein B n=1 Tax=hydrothermal vent metagenome TaxID=652676 RepID=A0A3B0RIS5_9ZZZZ
MRMIFALLLAGASTPVFAQSHNDHGGRNMPDMAEPTGETADEAKDPHAGHDMKANKAPQPDSQATDHGEMDHGAMSNPEPVVETPNPHTGHDMSSMPIPITPPPAEAFEGPAFGADQYWGAEAMAKSRAKVTKSIAGMPVFTFMADRAEYRARQGGDGYLWDVQGWYGRDIDKFWFKSEGEGSFGEVPETAEVQALWSHAIGPYFDLQLGARYDFEPVSRSYLVAGLQGLAPYWYEVDAAAFVSDKGDVTARIEAEYDQYVTQRLVLQPRAEVNFSLQDVPEQGLGSGLTDLELGIRLRYEIRREFAPYIGVEWEKQFGDTARFTKILGEDPSVTNFVVGIRIWF